MSSPYQAPKSNLEVTVPEATGISPQFKFQVGAHDILGEVRAATGRETVYVDGKRVTSELNWLKKTGIHDLHLDGEDYQLIFSMESVVKPIRRCTLEKNGVLIKRYESESKPKSGYVWVSILLVFLLTVFSGVLIDQFELSSGLEWVSWLLAVAIFITGIGYSYKFGSVEVTEVTD